MLPTSPTKRNLPVSAPHHFSDLQCLPVADRVSHVAELLMSPGRYGDVINYVAQLETALELTRSTLAAMSAKLFLDMNTMSVKRDQVLKDHMTMMKKTRTPKNLASAASFFAARFSSATEGNEQNINGNTQSSQAPRRTTGREGRTCDDDDASSIPPLEVWMKEVVECMREYTDLVDGTTSMVSLRDIQFSTAVDESVKKNMHRIHSWVTHHNIPRSPSTLLLPSLQDTNRKSMLSPRKGRGRDEDVEVWEEGGGGLCTNDSISSGGDGGGRALSTSPRITKRTSYFTMTSNNSSTSDNDRHGTPPPRQNVTLPPSLSGQHTLSASMCVGPHRQLCKEEEEERLHTSVNSATLSSPRTQKLTSSSSMFKKTCAATESPLKKGLENQT